LDEYPALVEKVCEQQAYITALYMFVVSKGLLPEFLEWNGGMIQKINQGDKEGGGKIN